MRILKWRFRILSSDHPRAAAPARAIRSRADVIEAKASRTITPPMAGPLVRLGGAVSGYRVTSLIVHRGTSGDAALGAVRPGVKAASVDSFLSALGRAAR